MNKNEMDEHNMMSRDSSDSRLSVTDSCIRNRDKTLLCWNGLIWSLGNSFVSTTLLIYILFGLVDKSEFQWIFLTTSVLTALPRIVGLFRLFAPKLLNISSSLSYSASFFYCLSGVSLCFIPLIILYQEPISLNWLVLELVVLWAFHHLNEYIGDIAVDCMVGELIPENHRGKYYALRSRYMLVGTILASAIAFLMKDYHFPIDHHLFWAWIGAGIIILSIIPLLFCTSCTNIQNKQEGEPVRFDVNSLIPKSNWFDVFFLPFRYSFLGLFLIYGIAFSFVNGLTQTTQFEYSVHCLGISFEFCLFLVAMCRIVQWCLNWIVGSWSDKAIRPTLMISQALVAFSLLFLGIASSDFYYVPIYLSWLCLSGYAGLNVGIPKYLQTLSHVTGNRPATFALYNAIGGLAFAISVMLSGFLLDLFGFVIDLTTYTIWGLQFFAFILLIGFILRLMLVWVLGLTIKPSFKRDES